MTLSTCFCIGPQNGEPLCPCRMRAIRQEGGRYVEHIDHGPVDQVGKIDFEPIGCICPPTSERTCANPKCPRQDHRSLRQKMKDAGSAR